MGVIKASHTAGEAVETESRLHSQHQALRAAEARAVRAEHAASVLGAAGDRMAEELCRTAGRPWRPFKRLVQRGLLRVVLLLGWMMSDSLYRNARRALAIRHTKYPVVAWERVKDEAWGKVSPVDPLLATEFPRYPFGKVMFYYVLRALAAASEPFAININPLALLISRRRACKLRRSAEKRSPFAVKGDCSAVMGALTAKKDSAPCNDPARQRRIIVADYRIPRPDVSAGEKATFGLLADLCALGMNVTFVPTDMSGPPQYREALEALGVTVITESSGHIRAEHYVRAEGHRFGVFYLIRVDVAEQLLELARATAPDARVIFHAPDLCHLREMRGAELAQDPTAVRKAAKIREREVSIMRAADHVVVVSPAELPLLADILPQTRVSVFPALYSAVAATPPGFEERSNIFFLGGFKHKPNVDAVIWFVEKVWPRIHLARPDMTFDILGAEAPPAVIALGNMPGVRFVGYVSDLDPVLARYRLSVAPLLYGAGIKGKLGMSMGAGVPCISTTIGAEGMGIVDGVHALVRDDPKGFAEAVVTLYGDPGLWEKISEKGRRLVEDRFGDAANQSAFYRVLDDAGALPLDMYVDWCQAVVPAPLQAPDPAEPVDVSIIVPVHNQWPLTRACLNSVLRAIRGAGITCEVILADDGSTDDTLRAASLFPGLRVIRQGGNLGFLRNCNAAAAEARGEALLFLNNDTVVLPGWLTELVRVLREEPSAAIVGSKLLYPDGTIQQAGGVLFSDASVENLGRGKPRRDWLFSLDREVDYLTGASILVRRSFWDSVGGFDLRHSPAYCADSDLAMAARHKGRQVIYAARSEVVKFGRGTYEPQNSESQGDVAIVHQRELLQKWRSSFEADHLPPGTQLEIAAAHAERCPPKAARSRRATSKLNVLYFSPFPSHPDNHGNQATIQSFGRRFRKMGHKVHFVLLESQMYDDVAVREMRAAWDSLDILPNSRPLWYNGSSIPFDHWYEPGLGEQIAKLCRAYDIDVVFCSYIFQSKLLEFVSGHVLKVIDTHDKMGDRHEMLRQKGQPVEFFSCTPDEEGRYLRRADVVVARRSEEAHYFDSVTGRKSAIVIPHVEEPRFIERHFGPVRTVAMVASANRINLAITLELLKALANRERTATLPFRLHIAGEVSAMVKDLPSHQAGLFSRPWVELHGFVPDIGAFYRAGDLVISPVTMGTGINVKTVQAMAFGMPLLATAWGTKGIETGHPMHSHQDVSSLVDGLLAIADDTAALNELARISRERYKHFLVESDANIDLLFERVRNR
jgi:GT2 family glycosyltransferase/glycosyltransferase involved in cell wall biosynthesis